jgi:hypothetical protein
MTSDRKSNHDDIRLSESLGTTSRHPNNQSFT